MSVPSYLVKKVNDNYKCEKCAQPCYIVTIYEVPDSCPYGFSQCQFKEVTPHTFLWGVRKVKRSGVV